MNRNTDNEEDIFANVIDAVVTEVQAETKSVEAKNIHDAIRFYLLDWLNEVKEINPLYEVREIIGVGSYAEGTMIIKPDEFDFLAVIDAFSRPNLLGIEESNFQKGLVKVSIKDDNFLVRCSQLYKNGCLRCFQPINFPKIDEKRFGHIFIEAVSSYAKKYGEPKGVGVASPISFIRNIQLPAINNVALLFVSAEYRAPNVLIEFKYQDKDISVDLSPAIRYYQLQDCFKVQNCAGPALSELVRNQKSLLLLGTHEEANFKITITEAEVEYMKSFMKRKHKDIYIMLKYITKSYTGTIYGFPPFTSYMMKTVCFHHDIKCAAEESSIKQCFEAIIEDLMICTQQEYVISIVDKDIHLVSCFQDFVVKNYRTSMLKDMSRICNLSADIKTAEDFHEFLKQCALEQIEQRKKDDEEKRKRIQEIEDEHQRKISSLTDMGFKIDAVENAMRSALNDPELALKILRKEAEDRKVKTLIEEEIISTHSRILGLPTSN